MIRNHLPGLLTALTISAALAAIAALATWSWTPLLGLAIAVPIVAGVIAATQSVGDFFERTFERHR